MKKIFALLMLLAVVFAGITACGQKAIDSNCETMASEVSYFDAELAETPNDNFGAMPVSETESLVVTAVDYSESRNLYVLGDHVNERQQNTTDSPITTTYMAGEMVTVTGEENGWYRLANGHYIRMDLLTNNYDDIVAHYRESNADLIVTYISRGYTECWYYGEKLFEGKCVTGDANNSPTPLGLYWITSRQTDVDMMDDPGLHADYFCTFNGLIGYHDASWRTVFGPDIYLTNGSHGCINCEYELARNIFNHCQVGITAVLILP